MLNGFSQLIYAMYMVKHETLPQTEQARKRVEAKQKLAEEKRKQRDSLRSLGRKEKEKRKEELREAQRIAALEKKKASKEKKEKEKMAREALLEPTIRLTQEEETLIVETTTAEEEKSTVQEGSANKKEEIEITLPRQNEEQFVSPEETEITKDEPVISWDSLSKEPSWEHALRQSDHNENDKQRADAVSFPEEQINFKLPQKPDVTEILEKEIIKPEPASFKPLVLEELIEEENKSSIEESKKKKEENDKRFTEEFSWDWPLKN